MPLALPVALARTIATAAALSLYVLLLGPPAILWTIVSRNSRFLFAAGAFGIRLAFGLAGIKVRVTGAEHILAGSGAVYASNHGSNLDPPVVFLVLAPLFPRVRVLYKAELRRLPVLVWVFDAAGFVPVERENRAQSFGAVDRAAEALRAGDSFLVFPEGTRSRTGELLPFKKGAFVMAIKGQTPIVPVVVSGGREAMRKGSSIIWPATVRVALAAPVPTAGLTFDDREAVVAHVRKAMIDMADADQGSVRATRQS